MGRPFTIQLTEEQVALLHVRDIDPPKRKRQAPLSDPKAVYEVLKHLEALEQEHLVVLTLTSRQHLIERHVISVGVVDASLAHPREIFRAAGVVSLARLHRLLDRRPGPSLYRMQVRWAGPDPRVALRADAALSDAALSDADRAALDQRLARLDGARGAAWTLEVLRLIADRPGVRAPDLAAGLGRETLAFKRDVRKLKELGLTHSLEVGYELSPRGAAYLDGTG